MTKQLEGIESLLRGHIEKSERQYDEIREALLGDEYGNEGLVKRLRKTEHYITGDRRRKWLFTGFFAALSLTGNELLQWLKKYL